MYKKKHSDYKFRARARKKNLLQQIPPWLTEQHKEEIRQIYAEAKRNGLTVDHIIPLKGKTVSGLHVPWNLQILSAEENKRKGNRF